MVINFPRIAAFGGFGGGRGFGGQQVDFSEAVKRRDLQIEDLKKLFKDAEAYGKVQDAYAKDKTLPTPKTDIKMEAMVPYVRGEKPMIFSAERERDIRAVVKFADEMKVKAIIIGGQEAWKAADLLKEKNIPVVYTNIYNLPVQDDDDYDYLFEAPSKMQKAGVKFCISTGNDGAEVRDLPYHAGTRRSLRVDKAGSLKIRDALSGTDFGCKRQTRFTGSRKNSECRRDRRRYAGTANECQISVYQRATDPSDQPSHRTLRAV